MATSRPGRTPQTRAPEKKNARLDEYDAKRDFGRTPEPRGQSSQEAGGAEKKTLQFCVQKHDATRLHYDVRLEIAGALMSFAVPKGPSYDPQVKRLAVETEDHPMMYLDFEARIPDGQYGAGDMLLWDRGTWETEPPGQEEKMRAKGHILARLSGEKLHGGWHFVKTKGTAREGGQAKPQWLMFKAGDETADAARDIVAERPESVTSGKSATRGPARVGASNAGKSVESLVAEVGETMRATLSAVDDVKAYSYELKYDGYRLLCAKAGDRVKIVTRGGHDWSARFPLIAAAVRKLPAREAVIDGEACVVDEQGRPSFSALQAWLAGEGREKGDARLAFATFDLLWLDGRDTRGLPLEERRELLEALVKDAPAPISFSRASVAATKRDFDAIVAAARAGGLEGIVAKRLGSKYTGGPSGAWKKVKFELRQDCAIVGWIPMTGAPRDLGALILAVMDGGVLRHAGRVGTGFDATTRARILARLAPLRVDAPPLEVPKTPGAHWVRPALVCEVAYGEWTRDGSLRRSSFVAMREDKTLEECAVETASTGAAPAGDREDPPHSAKSVARLKLSNSAKVLFPRDGLTKRDILDYYMAIAPVLLPHLRDRPLTLQRWPDGIDGEAWYQQNVPSPLPEFVRTIAFEKKKRVVVDNIESLAWLANLAALTLHSWSSRAGHLDRPDYVVLDLDPGDGTWADVIEVARAVRTLLDALSLQSAVKTSGKRGLHVVVPIAEGPTHEEATAFAERLARAVAKVLPTIATTERMKEKRGGRLYVDYLQNGEGKTIVSPYTIRALDGAPVSTPILWSEVTEKLDPRAFTIRSVPERVARHGDLFAIARSGKGRIL